MAPSRDFVFVDEHGNPGEEGSKYFASIAMHLTDESIEATVDCFSTLRFYRRVFGEYKNLDKDPLLRDKLQTMLWSLWRSAGVQFSITYLGKDGYTGPYLQPGEGTKFRNFQLRRLLEWHFHNCPPSSDTVELVLDRHSHSPGQLEELRIYLDGNRHLPKFAAITAVDSRYVELIAITDLMLRMWKRQRLDRNDGWLDLDLDFVQTVEVTKMYRGWRP